MKVNTLPTVKPTAAKDTHSNTSLFRQIQGYLRSMDQQKNSHLFSCLSEQSGNEQQIMLFTRECIAMNSKHRNLINYLYVLDYMLTLPSFNMIMHSYLVQFYCDIFKHLLSQSNQEAIDRMKILRKYWIARINFQLYSQMHEIVLRYFGVDIELIPEYALQDLRKFYLEHLKMNLNDVYYYLPQLKSLEYQKDQQDERPKYQLNKAKVEEYRTRNAEDRSKYSHDYRKGNIHRSKNDEKTIVEHNAERQFEIMKLHNDQKVTPSEKEALGMKRRRQQSQETTISVPGTKKMKYDQCSPLNSHSTNLICSVQQAGRHNRKQHSQKFPKFRALQTIQERGEAKGFNFLLCYSCQVCGMKFRLKKELSTHECDLDNIQKKSLEADKNSEGMQSVVVSQDECFNFSRTCNVCLRQMEADYSNGSWIFRNCIKLNIYDVPTILHSECRKDVSPASCQPSNGQAQ